MKAIVYDRYGPPAVLHPAEVARPAVGDNTVLVRVRASSVTAADWRARAAAFPGILWLPGRLMFGVFRPRNRILGNEFAGEVAEVGDRVTGFAPGDRVFGNAGAGAYGEYLAIPESAAIAPLPNGLDFDEAAALPFGTLCALVFLRDVAGIGPGHRLMVVGASGGVGCYAVQIGRHLGAEVTGVASTANLDFVRDLGAASVIDYTEGDIATGAGGFDVIFDTVGALGFARARRILAPEGVFVPLNYGLVDLFHLLTARFRGGQRIRIHVNADRKDDLMAVKALVEAGALRPVIDRRYPIVRTAEAHAHAESRHRRGNTVLTVED